MYSAPRQARPECSKALSEIQGIVSSDYANFPFMSCLLVHIESPNQALRLLQQVRNQISFSDVLSKSSDGRLNLGLTWEGLHRLDGEVLTKGAELFKREFREGMVTPHRQKILGDLSHSPSAPSNWFWGQGETKKVHLALLIYELTAEKRDARVNEILESPGIDLVDHGRIDSAQLKNGKEHFGFRDGISQPWLKELNSPGAISDEVAWGEIVLGYQDNSGVIERHPEIALNGSYLVVRQIEQDVEGFWKSVGGVNGDPIAVAAKQMGRWPDGTPITLEPNRAKNRPTNDFDFLSDEQGLKCPVGAHIRRCNPREGTERAVGKKDRHRILRRGRAYGPAAPAEFFPAALRSDVSTDNRHNGESRGLLFMCLNANFERQFEFIQNNWINGKVGTLSDELDPVASQINFETFTIPATPIRKRCTRSYSNVKTVGGGYFFLPSRTTLEKIIT